MLSVAKLTLGQEAYYEQQVARGVDDYYAGRGESPGIWAGRGSAILEARRRRRRRRSSARCCAASTRRRRTPACAGASGRSPCGRSTSRAASGATSRSDSPRSPATTSSSRARRASACCTRSPRTSGCAGRSGEAHESAWQAALGYLEREACVVRRGQRRQRPRARRGVRRRRVPAPHLAGAGPAPAHARDRRQPLAGRGRAMAALDGEAILAPTGSPPATSTRPTCGTSSATGSAFDWTEPVKGMGEIEGVPERRSEPSRRAASRWSSTWKRSALKALPPPAWPPSPPGRRRIRRPARLRGLEGPRGRAGPVQRELNGLVSLPSRARSRRPRRAGRAAARTGRVNRDSDDVHDAGHRPCGYRLVAPGCGRRSSARARRGAVAERRRGGRAADELETASGIPTRTAAACCSTPSAPAACQTAA